MNLPYNISLISRRYICGALLILTTATACEKTVEVDPPTNQIGSQAAYSSDASATSVMTGMYGDMMSTKNNFASGLGGFSVLEGLASDELVNYLPATFNAQLQQFYTNTYDVNGSYFWNELYKRIYLSNLMLEGVSASTSLSTGVKNQLLGEAKFNRAFAYFYAVNTYGDVPLALTSDYRTNNKLGRAPKEQIYNQIVADLKDAQSLMGDAYFKGTLPGTSERARPNKGAATALLARVYLYRKDWANAETQASAVISNAAYKLESDLKTVFLGTSKEAIWQLQTVLTNNSATFDGALFIPSVVAPGTSDLNPVALSSMLLDAFETGDARRTMWVDSFTVNDNIYYFPFKYTKNFSLTPEYLMVFRLAEQYLIRAEARAQLGNITGANSAQSDLDAIRGRASLPGTTAKDKESMLAAIAQERRTELFTEWGHRWFDLVRTDKADEVMSIATPLKGGAWDPNHKLLPIPFSEIQLNNNLKQNPGYSN